MVLYTELFYAIIPACFHTFCCSVIPTSPYILMFFTLVGNKSGKEMVHCIVMKAVA